MEQNQQKDALTGELFYLKRSNQRFASRRNQIKYNNLKATRKRRQKAFVDKPLDKNRTILIRILGDKKEITRTRDYLLGAGYDFGRFTHSKRVSNASSQLITCVYEFCLLKIEDNQYKIFKDE